MGSRAGGARVGTKRNRTGNEKVKRFADMHTGGLVGNCTKGVEYGATREKDERKTADVGEEVWCDSTCWREGGK